MVSEVELLGRLATAGGAGMLIGLEREARAHAAGVRTHALVALGAAVFTVAGAYGFNDVQHGPNVDPARVAAQVAAGIGFIGAGAIIRHGTSVRGLTTAATLWLAAALGVAAGAGLYLTVAMGTALVFITVVGVRAVRPQLLRALAGSLRALEVEYERGHGTIGPLMRAIDELDVRVEGIRIHDGDGDGDGDSHLRRVRVELIARHPEQLDGVVQAMLERDEVRSAMWGPAREPL
jgi:putative Mg2+ transporter-C (MgtC) family protein